MAPTQDQWQEIVEAHYADIYAYAFRFLGSKDEAEDLTQDVFLKAWLVLERGDLIPEIRPWLFVIARNRCIDKKRWWKRWLGFLSSTQPAEPEAFEASEFNTDILQTLPKRQREIFILRHWHDFSTAQTANLLGISEGAVKSQLKKAVESLKKRILDE